MDWGYAYEAHRQDMREQLEDLRRGLRSRVRLTHRTIETRSLSDDEIESLATRDAEMTVNAAINQHNEQVARKS